MAYAGLPVMHCLEMTKENLLASLFHLELQWHLLGVVMPIIDVVARAGNKFLHFTVIQTGQMAPIGRTYQVHDEKPTTYTTHQRDQVKCMQDDRIDR